MSGKASFPSRLVDPLLAAVLAAGALALYVRTLAPTVLAGDPGEFQFAAWLLGVAHATGYPLYTLLGWAWSHLLPIGDPAYRMNLFSAVWGAFAVGLLYLTAGALLRQAVPGLPPAATRLTALLSAATFAATPTFWSQAIIAEVYSLHTFLVVALLYCLLAWREATSPKLQQRYLLLAACCFGLGLAHHRTTLVLIPAIAAYLWLARRPLLVEGRQQFRREALRRLAKLAAAVGLPLLLYLYIPWRAPHTSYLHLSLGPGRDLILYHNTLGGFLNFILGGPFGGSLDLSVNLLDRLAMAGQLLWSEVPWPGLLLAGIGLGWLAWRRAWSLLALTGLAYLATVAFNLVYMIGDIYVLFIPSYLVITLWIAVGLGAAALGVTRVTRQRYSGALALASAALLAALPLWMVVTHFAGMDRSHDIAARSGWEAILAEPLPEGAVLLSNDRNDIVPMWYLQYMEGRRPDLLGLFPLITPDVPDLGSILDLALGTGRPLYLIKDMPGIDIKVRTEGDGRLWRVAGPAVEHGPANPRDARLGDAVRWTGYDQTPSWVQAGQAIDISLYWEALRPLHATYHSFVHLLDLAGQRVTQSDRQPGGVFYPSTLWRPGQPVCDRHTITIPPATAPGTYRLLVGLYELAPDGTIRMLGDPVVAGEIEVTAGVSPDSQH